MTRMDNRDRSHDALHQIDDALEKMAEAVAVLRQAISDIKEDDDREPSPGRTP